MTPSRLTLVSLTVVFILFISTGTALASTHTVRSGDTLWDISRQHGVSVQALAQANGISESDILQIGQELTIPSSSSSGSSSVVTGGRIGTVVKSAPLRSEPSSEGSVLATLPQGTRLQIHQTKWDWHHVTTSSGAKGWVGGYLVRIAPSTARGGAEETRSQAVATSQTASSAVQTAMGLRGSRYRYGGSSTAGFDCSGFTRYVYARHGVNLPHNSAAQFNVGNSVSKSELQPGDLVFFAQNGRRIGHVGIFIGNGQFVHASNPRGGVRVDSLNTGSYARNYVGAKRVR